MVRRSQLGLLLVGWVILTGMGVSAAPPFSGTVYIDPDIITSSDPTTFQGVTPAGQGSRRMFDRRPNDWVEVNAYLFNASFSDGLAIEIQVNPEFGNPAAARVMANKFGAVIGRLPTALRAKVKTVWIHKGNQLFGGGNENLLIHTDQAATYEKEGILEETLVHEAVHTSLDGANAAAAGWLAAQKADNEFISTYARENPTREDLAESFLPYLAVRLRPDRIAQAQRDTITRTIPSRMWYFDQQKLDLHPIGKIPESFAAAPAPAPAFVPPTSAPAQVTASEALKAKLNDTRWSWPDRSFGQRAFYILKTDGTVSAGWHNRGGWWKVVGENVIEAQIAASSGPIQVHFDADLKKGHLKTLDGQVTERLE